MTGQHRIRKIVEPSMTGFAEIALPMRLRLITAIADNRRTVATGTAHTLGPAMLAHQIKAFGIVQQRREVDQLGYRHADSLPAQGGISSQSSNQMPPSAAIPTEITTPKPDKSQGCLRRHHGL
jgi:hypothetical protein